MYDIPHNLDESSYFIKFKNKFTNKCENDNLYKYFIISLFFI